ncbi:MAG: T9SS type A sorting domain-containing protein [Candidatus Marinimicrobia bacterium]|jgi:flagellar hook assembly protein FlgD|nr:T9SS type A sorting domain-containing protein [Candidatus Neomarinimicrobiota bacterium]MBT3680056.1 T9SS type A sorting domain-containing protein [Candidatus Neomarinimicrobiota bacterium]MBT3950041.1 T9SS type A sorting domain-containing protein [Candidatus Neomarinimicrobiota bacterium]MBT4480330.1 T9SS type A sorting domain-containing protein [Candidatus Neomarinimicrobiota bacterium]MBT5235705.1 T9SS type A sorting domain-containing protein [Candidatus Neomarinimicrobiota bacterium]
MKRINILVIALTLIFGLATTSYANVYATNLAVSAEVITTGTTNTTVDISFLLNEDADSGVDVKIYSGATLVRTITLATAVKGSHSVTWDGTDAGGTTLADGDYTFEVVAADDGNTAWTQISDNLLTVMYSPKGVSINRDIDSPHFGTVYISNGYAGTSANAGGVYNGDGIYLFSAAQDSLTFSDGGISWGHSSNSPNKTSIGDDGRVYVTDYGADELYVFDADISPASAFRVLDADNKVADQYISANWVHGTGADRVIYTADAHYATGQGILEYAIGLEDTMVAGNYGEVAIERPNNGYYQLDVETDQAGNIYFCQKRADPNQAYPLLKYPPYTGTTLTIDDTLWTVPMTYAGANGIALDEVNNRIAWGSYYSGTVYIHNATTGALIETFETGQSRTQDLAFDAAGNLYTVDNGSEYWHIWSSPDGANSFTSPGQTEITIETPALEGDVLVNEFDTNTSSAEYIELFNTTDVAIDLATDSYVLVFVNGNGDAIYQATDLTGSIPANGFYVLAETGVTDIGGYTPDQNASWGSFQNGTDAFGLVKGAAASDFANSGVYSTSLAAVTGATQQDAVIYAGGDYPDTGLEAEFNLPGGLVLNGSAGSSSRITDGQGGSNYANSDWEIKATRTPGSTNFVPPPTYIPYTIVEIQTPDAGGDTSQYYGEFVETTGIITALTSYSFYIQDGTADYSGIYVYINGSTSAYALGDEITVQGVADENNSKTQIASITDVTINSSGNALPAPIVLITNTLSEGHEGMLVEISGECTAVSSAASTDHWAFKLDDGSGDALVDDQIFSDAETSATLGTTYNVVGAVNFYYGAFTVNPRDIADIEEVIIENDLMLTFEDDTDAANWGVYDGATGYTTVTFDATAGVDGSGAMVFGDGGYAYYIKRPISATVGTDYVLSVDLKTLGWDNPDTYPITLSIEGLEAEENSVSINSLTEFTNIILMGTSINPTGYIKLQGANTSAAGAGGTINVAVDNLMFDDDYVPPPSLDLDLVFEDDTDAANWGVYDGATGYTTVAFDATAGVGGSGAMVFGDGGYGYYIKRPVAATIGTDYSLSIDIKTLGWDNPDSYPITLAVEGLDAVENSISINSLTDFTTITLTGTATTAAGYIKLQGSNTSAAGAGGTISVTVDNLMFDDNSGATDIDHPVLLAAGALSSSIVELVFNEDIDPVTGANVANYSVDHSIGAPTAAVVLEDIVTLTLGTGMMFDSTYTVIVNNVADVNGNVLLADTASFMYTYEFVSDLFFSEYIEGSSNNKALEIYNPTDAAIDLAGYTIGGTSNEATDWEYFYTFPDTLTMSIAAMSTYVIADASADSVLQAQADWVSSYPGPTSYNGNDARGLFKVVGLDTILIDALGNVDNATAADYAAAGIEDAMGEHTLLRKANFTMGNPDWMMSAGTDAASSEWVVFPQNTFRFLGTHPHTDLVGPELAGIVAVSETQLQLRFSEPVLAADALTLTNYSVQDFAVFAEMPTAITMVNEKVFLLDIPAIAPNVPYTLHVSNVHDMSGNVIMDGANIGVVLDIPGSLPIDRIINDFVGGIGNWADPTYSGSTYGILTSSTFASTDTMSFAGTHSGEMVLTDDPATSGGWFVRLWNINRVDRIDADSRMFFYLYGGTAAMQARIVVQDDGGYEAGPWRDITDAADDWQVISFDLANDPATGWINGNGAIDAASGTVGIDCIQIRSSEDISPVLYVDMVTERYNIEPVEVTFDVNMSIYTLMETFDMSADFVDVAGNFNAWGEVPMVLDDPEADSLYTITLTDVYPGESLEYKFRINGSWSDDTAEFPFGGPARVYVVPDTNSTVFHWYNDVDEYVGFAGMLIPTEYALHDNYPNPFNPITNIKYDIPENTHVTIAVYNTLGQHVIDLVNEEQAAGYYHMQWNGLNKRGTPVGSGLYFYRLTTSEFTQSEKMTYLK